MAVFSEEGQILKEHKFPTSPNYKSFLKDLSAALKEIQDYKITVCCCALPALIDRQRGIGITFGNLKWQNVPAKDDLKDLLQGADIFLESDSNLAGLHESLVFKSQYHKVLYITIGTGIGDAVVVDGQLDEAYLDSEGGQMVLSRGGKLTKWEDFASGRAIVERFGKKAADIDDPSIWKLYASDLAQGLATLIAPFQPDVVIIGGGVGAHFAKYGAFLNEELKKYQNNMVTMPPVIQARKPEEAVIYGCYDFIRLRQGYGGQVRQNA
ncbi:ROK family protein [Candidatus Saccharibacteria bacterium]|nr:ROK family protein [Candidatus Saccharibacteria bacterium]